MEQIKEDIMFDYVMSRMIKMLANSCIYQTCYNAINKQGDYVGVSLYNKQVQEFMKKDEILCYGYDEGKIRCVPKNNLTGEYDVVCIVLDDLYNTGIIKPYYSEDNMKYIINPRNGGNSIIGGDSKVILTNHRIIAYNPNTGAGLTDRGFIKTGIVTYMGYDPNEFLQVGYDYINLYLLKDDLIYMLKYDGKLVKSDEDIKFQSKGLRVSKINDSYFYISGTNVMIIRKFTEEILNDLQKSTSFILTPGCIKLYMPDNTVIRISDDFTVSFLKDKDNYLPIIE